MQPRQPRHPAPEGTGARTARRYRRLSAFAAAALVCTAAAKAAPASAEPEGAYCTIYAFSGSECVGNLHTLTRSSTYSSSNLYVSAGAYTAGGAPYGSLVYGTGYACHPYGNTSLAGRSRNSGASSGSLTGSQYWNGTSC